MNATSPRAKIVRVRVEEGKAGLFYATSPDLKGLLVANATLDGLEKEIPKTIAGLFAAREIDVVVTKAHGEGATWVAVPVIALTNAHAREPVAA